MNSWTAEFAPESINRNRPISIARFLPFKRIAVSPDVSRRAIFGMRAAVLEWTQRAEERFDGVNLRDDARPNLMFPADGIAHAPHYESVG